MTPDLILIGNAKSPFVRKVMAFAHVCGLAERIALRAPGADPVFAENPLGKIPTLVLPGGDAVIESELIIAELDALAGGQSRLPTDRAGRRRRALASGALDCAVARIYETRRPAGMVWDDWIAKQKAKADAALDALDAEAGALSQKADAETTTVASLLGYLDFRYPQDGWRAGRPQLAAWYEAFSKHPCMTATEPRDE